MIYNCSIRVGALIFALAVVVFGAGKLLSAEEDRAVSFVFLLVGVFSVLGVVGHLLTGL